MMRLLFIRHGAIEGLGQRIAGREPGNHLNRAGRAQAARLGERLRSFAISAIYSSPQARAIETAEALGGATRTPVERLAELDELNFGDWTGKTYDELHTIPEWRAYNALRAVTRIPNGELLLDVQHRVIACADALRRRHEGKIVALVTHGDVIRAALAYYMGAPLEFIVRFEISPASVSSVELSDAAPRILAVNENLHQTDAEEALDGPGAAVS